MSHSRGLGPAARGWCSNGCTRTPTLAGWCSRLHRWGGVGVVFQKVVPESWMGWCSRSWGGAPKSCPRILDRVVFKKLGWCSKTLSQNPPWGGVPKVGMVFQKVVPESPRLDGVVFQKLGWCSKKLSQNPHSVYYYLQWGKYCPGECAFSLIATSSNLQITKRSIKSRKNSNVGQVRPFILELRALER